MKKKILTVFLLSLHITSSYGQDKNDLDNMINNSIGSIIKMHQEFVLKGTVKRESFDKYYIFKDNLPLNFVFSESIINQNLRISFIAEIPNKELENGVFGLCYNSFILNKDSLTLNFVTKGVKKRKKSIDIGLADGFTFTYQYFCNEKKWRLVDKIPR